MAYRGGGASMFVLLPRDQGTGRELDQMVQRLTTSTLTTALKNTRAQTVQLKFPKFKFEKKIDETLQQVFSLVCIYSVSLLVSMFFL